MPYKVGTRAPNWVRRQPRSGSICCAYTNESTNKWFSAHLRKEGEELYRMVHVSSTEIHQLPSRTCNCAVPFRASKSHLCNHLHALKR